MAATEKPSLKEQAATWLVALDGGRADVAAFEAWRNADPRHAAAFAMVAATWEKLGDARPLAASDAKERPARQHGNPMSRRQILKAASVVAAAGTGLMGSRLWARSSATTGIGERRTILLRDGTGIDLNTDSAAEWIEGAHGPRIWLQRGEIALDIAPADGGAVLDMAGLDATLTPGRYNARIQDGIGQILVLAGALSSDSLARPVRAGQQLSAGKDGRGAILIDADADERERAIGWRRGEIVLSGEPLDAVLSEYNRYLTHKIVIGDPQLRSIRMGGRFTSNDPAEFLSALHASFGIVARRQEEQTLLFAQTVKNFPA